MNAEKDRSEKMKRALLIYNPKAGRDSARPSLEEITELFPGTMFDLTVKETTRQGEAADFAENLSSDKDLIIVCGGDGTLNEAVGGLMKLGRKIPVGYIPIGSTNDLAKTLGIPTDIVAAASIIIHGEARAYDIGEFNGGHFTYVSCFGPGTCVSYNTPQKMKNKLGYSAYMINGFLFSVIPTLKQVKPKHIRIEYDGDKVIDDNFYFGAVSNSASVAGMFKYDENDVRLNDGKFEIMLVRRLNRPTDIFKMLRRIMKRDYDGDSLLYFKSGSAEFKFDSPEDWSLDGELRPGVKSVSFKALGGAIDIYCPDGKMFSR